MARVLIVEDDPTVSEVVESYLRRSGHDTWSESDGREAARLVTGPAASEVDLVILDLMLPSLDGIEVCRLLRQSRPVLPVIMLTALGQEDDRIAGLEVGADDYVTKPFSPRELVLRVESVLRRSLAQPAGVARLLTLGPITVDTAAHRVTKDGAELALTGRELDLLSYLMRSPGTAYTRTELMAAVWGWTFGDQSTVTVHVRRLREKIEDDPQQPKLIQTVWGVGYRMEAP
ncbi:MAG TPA: response regulator transcription factor [Jatrophihabitans sp.]|nr:response regulator transcription factor [Jatrophihabitans sp.]